MFNYLNYSQLTRAITTTKNYIVIDTGFSGNHSIGKVTFTNTLPDLNDEMILCIDLACDQSGLHYEVQNMVDRVSSALTRDCYYDSLENNLKSYGLTEYKYKKALRYLRD